MSGTSALRAWWWLVFKDLRREACAPRGWAAMLLLGISLALVISLQSDLPPDQQRSVVGGWFWLAVFFAGTIAIDRSFSGERELGCWHGLLLYPVAPGTIFLAKMTVNFLSLVCLEVVLIPVFSLFADVALPARPWPLLAVVLVANTGFAAAGTLTSALTNGLVHRGGLLALLLLPLVSPVVIGSAEATRLFLAGGPEWIRWTELLACFGVLFTVLGMLGFEFVIEE